MDFKIGEEVFFIDKGWEIESGELKAIDKDMVWVGFRLVDKDSCYPTLEEAYKSIEEYKDIQRQMLRQKDNWIEILFMHWQDDTNNYSGLEYQLMQEVIKEKTGKLVK